MQPKVAKRKYNFKLELVARNQRFGYTSINKNEKDVLVMKNLFKNVKARLKKDLFQPTLLEQLELERELISKIERKKNLLNNSNLNNFQPYNI